MKAQNIIYGLVALIIAVIITVSAVVPIFMETTKTDDTFTNSGRGSYKYISNEDEYTLTWYYETPTKITVNDVVIDAVSGNDLVAMGDFCVRIQPTNSGYAQLILANNESGVTANVSDSKNFTLTYSSGDLTVTNGTTTKTLTIDGFYAIVPPNDNAATHTMKISTDRAYLKSDTNLIVMGLTSVGGQWNTGYMVEGTLTDYSVSQWTGSVSYEPTNVSDDSATVSGYIDLYTIKQFNWIVDNSGTPVNVTYNYFLVPNEVTAERSIHPDGPTSTIINLIPLIIVAGILLLAIVYFIRRA